MVYRTHNCNQLSKEHVGEHVVLSGWVNTRREHGGILFFDLRDRWGITQVTMDQSQVSEELFHDGNSLKNEYVIRLEGEVIKRPEANINKKLTTGEIEVSVKSLLILGKSKSILPFEINKNLPLSDEISIKYRYLDIRREVTKELILLRHELVRFVRNFFYEKSFIEVETPLLSKSTPEGARDFLVPSRLHAGDFYALPQSPQQYKELLMVGGIDKYFQIARCLRDEDTRADRAAEHTQIDFEMSFVSRDDVIAVIEELIISLSDKFSDKKLMSDPLPRLKYHDVMNEYGTDKPDLRFDMKLVDISEDVRDSSFKVFSSQVANGGVVKSINAQGCSHFSRKDMDDLVKLAGVYGAKGLAWFNVTDDGLVSPIAKFFTDEQKKTLADKMNAKPGDLLLFVADKLDIANVALGQIRSHLGDVLKLKDENILAFAIVVDFPMFEYNEDEKRLQPLHHMFTLPKKEDLHLLDTAPLDVISNQYDLVCNGYECCSGSLRIHTRELQEKIMSMIGITGEEQIEKFGHLLEAFEYGAPPHGGAAPGVERTLMVLTGATRLKDTVAFPKTQNGRDLMMNAPSNVSEEQLRDLYLRIRKIAGKASE